MKALRALAAVGVFVLAGCGNDGTPQSTSAASKPVAATATKATQPAPAASQSVADMLAEFEQKYPTLPAALVVLAPAMTDTVNEVDNAAITLALWARNKLTWSALQALPEGKYAMVMKDPDAQRGKRLCVSGTVVEINADDSAGKPKVFHGGIMDASLNATRFIAVGDTGEIVARSKARFCGVITGKMSYSNSAGGSTHAVHLVGMFDLPENRK